VGRKGRRIRRPFFDRLPVASIVSPVRLTIEMARTTTIGISATVVAPEVDGAFGAVGYYPRFPVEEAMAACGGNPEWVAEADVLPFYRKPRALGSAR
jgi:hypothetical protein